MSDPEPPVDVDAAPLPPVEWAMKDMRARVDITDRDAVQDVLDRDAGWLR